MLSHALMSKSSNPPGRAAERGDLCLGALLQRREGAAAALLGERAAAGEHAGRAGMPTPPACACTGVLSLRRMRAPGRQGRRPLRSCLTAPHAPSQSALRDGAAATELPGASTMCLVALAPDCRSASALNLVRGCVCLRRPGGEGLLLGS